MSLSDNFMFRATPNPLTGNWAIEMQLKNSSYVSREPLYWVDDDDNVVDFSTQGDAELFIFNKLIQTNKQTPGRWF